jgi:hypothetical protein
MSIFRFFCQSGEFDPKETYDAIATIDHWCKGVKNTIYMIQLKKYDDDEPSVMDATPSRPGFVKSFQNFELSQEDAVPGAFVNYVNEIDENLKVLKETSDRFDQMHEDPLNECVQNIEIAESNLRRFQNMVDLSEIFPLK